MFNEAQLRALTDKVAAQQLVVDQVEAKLAQAEADAANTDGSAGQLIELRRQRDQAVGRAYIDEAKPDLKAMDAEIARIEKASAEARARAQAAQHALPLLEAQISCAVATLTEMIVAQLTEARGQVRTAMEAKRDAAKAACETLLQTVAETQALARIADALTQRIDGRQGNDESAWLASFASVLGLPLLAGAAPTLVRGRADPIASDVEAQLAEVGIAARGRTLAKKQGPSRPTEQRQPTVSTLAPERPTALHAEPGDGRVRLRWECRGAESYELSRAGAASGPWLATTTANSREYIASNLQNGVPAYFKVRGRHIGGAGPWSEVICATPDASRRIEGVVTIEQGPATRMDAPPSDRYRGTSREAAEMIASVG